MWSHRDYSVFYQFRPVKFHEVRFIFFGHDLSENNLQLFRQNQLVVNRQIYHGFSRGQKFYNLVELARYQWFEGVTEIFVSFSNSAGSNFVVLVLFSTLKILKFQKGMILSFQPNPTSLIGPLSITYLEPRISFTSLKLKVIFVVKLKSSINYNF